MRTARAVASLQRVCAIPSGWRSIRRRASCGVATTIATIWAMTSRPNTSTSSRTGATTDGPRVISPASPIRNTDRLIARVSSRRPSLYRRIPRRSAFYTGAEFPREYRGDAFVTLHGSWNRSVPTGAKVVRVEVDSAGRRAVGVEDFIVGWQRPDGSRWGRPVGLLVLPDGSLLVSDDMGGKIWRVSYGR